MYKSVSDAIIDAFGHLIVSCPFLKKIKKEILVSIPTVQFW